MRSAGLMRKQYMLDIDSEYLSTKISGTVLLISVGIRNRLSRISTYGLTYDEVLIVDPETPITKKNMNYLI